jgi:hypothetical protein
MGRVQGEDVERSGTNSSFDGGDGRERIIAPGKQSLVERSVGGGSPSSAPSGQAGGGQRVEAWHADDGLMAAMGLFEGTWRDEEEASSASEEERVSRGDDGAGGGGGGMEGGGEEAACAERPARAATTSQPTGGGAASEGGGQAVNYEHLFAAAPQPLSPGPTTTALAVGKTVDMIAGPPSSSQKNPAVQRQSANGAGDTSGQDFLQAGWAQINQPGIVYDEAGANLRSAPAESSTYLTLAQNTKVQILKHNPETRWYAVVRDDGSLGYVADWLLWRHLPEENTGVYRIKKGDTPLTIARDHYAAHFDRWGQDLRFVVNALVYVNNKGTHNGVGSAGLMKKGGVTESWLRANATEDVFIWLPSADYLNTIYEEVRKHGGGTGSISFDAFAKVADHVGAFSLLPSYVGGLAHGFLQSLGDTVGGIFDLLKSVFTGEIIEDVKKLLEALKKLTIDDVVAALGSWAQSWAPRLTSESPFVRGHAWGYFAGYLCAEIAMFAVGGGALNALKASKLATKLGQLVARVAPKLTAAVSKVTAVGRVSVKVLGEAKDAVLKRFAVAADAVGEVMAKARFSSLIKAATAAGVSAADANRLAKVLNAAGISSKKVADWGAEAFTKLASSPRTLAELEATLPFVKSGRIVGLEDWLKFGATKTGDDAARVSAELREARRLAKEYPEHKINVGGDAKAPGRAEDSPLTSFDLSVEDAAGQVARSVEMTSVEGVVTKASELSSAITHAAEKAAARIAKGQPIPGKIESVVQVKWAEIVQKGKSGYLKISRNGDVVMVTKGVPEKHIGKGNIFDKFVEKAPDLKGHELVDAVTVVERDTGSVLARIERNGAVWERKQ